MSGFSGSIFMSTKEMGEHGETFLIEAAIIREHGDGFVIDLAYDRFPDSSAPPLEIRTVSALLCLKKATVSNQAARNFFTSSGCFATMSVDA